jgi:hypothetical protein
MAGIKADLNLQRTGRREDHGVPNFSLDFNTAENGLFSITKGAEETVAGAFYDPSAMSEDSPSDDCIMGSLNVFPEGFLPFTRRCAGHLPFHVGRTDDVGEHESHEAGWKRGKIVSHVSLAQNEKARFLAEVVSVLRRLSLIDDRDLAFGLNRLADYTSEKNLRGIKCRSWGVMSFAALPPDVRKGSAFPRVRFILLGCAHHLLPNGAQPQTI